MHNDAPMKPSQRMHKGYTTAIGAGVPCPECSYDLRGLTGATIHCPECGGVFDRHKLADENDKRACAELAGAVGAPAFWSFLIFCFWVFAAGIANFFPPPDILLLVLTLVAIALYLFLLTGGLLIAWPKLGLVQTLWLSLLAHVAMYAFLTAIGWSFFAIVSLFASELDLTTGGIALMAIMGLLCLSAWLWRWIPSRVATLYHRHASSAE